MALAPKVDVLYVLAERDKNGDLKFVRDSQHDRIIYRNLEMFRKYYKGQTENRFLIKLKNVAMYDVGDVLNDKDFDEDEWDEWQATADVANKYADYKEIKYENFVGCYVESRLLNFKKFGVFMDFDDEKSIFVCDNSLDPTQDYTEADLMSLLKTIAERWKLEHESD